MVKYSNEIIGYINLFEKITMASVKDCFLDDNLLTFVVGKGQIKKALGPNGSNIKKLNSLFKKRIKIIGFHPDPAIFVANLLYPIRPKDIVIEGSDIVIRTDNSREKGLVFGREKSNLRKMQEFFSKYFPDMKIRVE